MIIPLTSQVRHTCMDRLALSSSFLEEIEQLSCHERAWVGLLQGTSLVDYIFCRVRPLDTRVSGRGPPIFHVLDFLLK